ncbi:MAG TPA: BlaI/MecI/CopY family transcriptional regulator [Pirellulales bacterium]|jgi:predicted transcriptional regulator|nr:BlaI/MecI/CopY family transcriptional regulator [Pirellulales bacterium]
MARDAKSKQDSAAKPKPLTDVEWAIMGAVWEHEPCTAGTVQEALHSAHGWAYSTVKTTMDRMVAKGVLGTHAIRNLQMFVPLITRTEAKRAELRRLLSRAFNGALTPMIQFLVEDEGLSADELKQLRKLLDRPIDKSGR